MNAKIIELCLDRLDDIRVQYGGLRVAGQVVWRSVGWRVLRIENPFRTSAIQYVLALVKDQRKLEKRETRHTLTTPSNSFTLLGS